MTGRPDSLHTAWSDPGPHAASLAALGDTPLVIADTLEQFVIHHAIAPQIGVAVPPAAAEDRSLRLAAALLGTALARDPRPLDQHRAIGDYLYVTCRDFSMLAMSALRQRGIEARLRVGFAAYFNKGQWLDHWVCEFRADGLWRMFDGQLGRRAREGLGIDFDSTDVPLTRFLTAGPAWRAFRAGDLDPALCGLPHAGIAGAWWLAGSVLRDAAALAGLEALPWDHWGPAVAFQTTREVTEAQAIEIDALAAALEPAPDNRHEAVKLLARFRWAAPGPGQLG